MNPSPATTLMEKVVDEEEEEEEEDSWGNDPAELTVPARLSRLRGCPVQENIMP